MCLSLFVKAREIERRPCAGITRYTFIRLKRLLPLSHSAPVSAPDITQDPRFTSVLSHNGFRIPWLSRIPMCCFGGTLQPYGDFIEAVSSAIRHPQTGHAHAMHRHRRTSRQIPKRTSRKTVRAPHRLRLWQAVFFRFQEDLQEALLSEVLHRLSCIFQGYAENPQPPGAILFGGEEGAKEPFIPSVWWTLPPDSFPAAIPNR